MYANHTSTLLHLLENGFRIRLRPNLFMAARNNALQLLSNPSQSSDDDTSSSPPLSLQDVFPFDNELSVIDGHFTGRRFHLVSSSNDFVRIRFENGEIRLIKKRFAGIQFFQLRRSSRIGEKATNAHPISLSELTICDEENMNEVWRWIRNRHRRVHWSDTLVTSVHTIPKLRRRQRALKPVALFRRLLSLPPDLS